ncbi:MAG: GIY-YIG nuclease family protein [Candidatus Hydrothermarchaeales archaeon]
MKSYALLMELRKPARIKVGGLGTFDFPKGCYLYVGSALRNIDSRITRHLRRVKKKRWHVDYLLEKAEIRRISLYHLGECELNQLVFKTPGAIAIVPGFGSSDCRKCKSHLTYFSEEPDLSELEIQSLLSSG